MRKAYAKKAMTPEQEKVLKAYVAKIRVVFDRSGNMEYRFPDREGKFEYKTKSAGAGCYNVIAEELGDFKACVEGRDMTLLNQANGVVESYNKSRPAEPTRLAPRFYSMIGQAR